MTINLDDIERIAREATPGPWRTNVFLVVGHIHRDTSKCGFCHHGEPEAVFDRPLMEGAGPGFLPIAHRHAIQPSEPDDEHWRTVYTADGGCIIGNYDYESGGIATTEKDAVYIATADPTTVLEMVSEIRALRQQLAEVDAAIAERYVTSREAWGDDYETYMADGDLPPEVAATDAAIARHRERMGK